MGLRIDGVDISHHQGGPLDFKRARAAGVKFVYHKATEGTTFRDSHYERRRNEARKAGLPFGAYHFARPDLGDAKREAETFLKVAKPQPGDLLPCLDLEVRGELSQAQLQTWMGRFIQTVKAELGVIPLVYTPFDFAKNFGAMLWQPRYNNDNRPPVTAKPWKHVDIWQFSDGRLGRPNSCPGLGHVDLNTFRSGTTLDDLIIPKDDGQGGGAPKNNRSTGPVRITTQNIQALPAMAQDHVREDVALTARQSGVIGWQEIKRERYDNAVQALEGELGKGDWETYWGQGIAVPGFREPADDREHSAFASPISWRHKYWEFVEGGKWKLHVKTSGINDDRWVCWVLLRHKDTGARVMFFNLHFVAGAWTKRKVSRQLKRKKMWRSGWKRLHEWLKSFVLSHPDAAICGMGDFNASLARDGREFNRSRRRWVRGRRVRITHPKAIDHLLLINGRVWKWYVEKAETLPGRNSDHQGRRVRARLVRRK